MYKQFKHFSMIVVLLCAVPALAQKPYTVITAEGTAVATLNEEDLGRLFLGKLQVVDGNRLIPAMADKGAAVERAFFKEVLDMDGDRFARHWQNRLFSSRGTAPRELGSVAKLVEFVQRTPGAVAVVPAETVLPAGVRFIAFPPEPPPAAVATVPEPVAPAPATVPEPVAPAPATVPAPASMAPASAPATAP